MFNKGSKTLCFDNLIVLQGPFMSLKRIYRKVKPVPFLLQSEMYTYADVIVSVSVLTHVLCTHKNNF